MERNYNKNIFLDFKNEFIEMVRENKLSFFSSESFVKYELLVIKINLLWEKCPSLFIKIVKNPSVYLESFIKLLKIYHIHKENLIRENLPERKTKVHFLGPIGRNYSNPSSISLGNLGELVSLRGRITTMDKKEISAMRLVLQSRKTNKFITIDRNSDSKDNLYTLLIQYPDLYPNSGLSIFEDYQWITMGDMTSNLTKKRIKILLSGENVGLFSNGDVVDIIGSISLVKIFPFKNESRTFDIALIAMSVTPSRIGFQSIAKTEKKLIESFSIIKNCLNRISNFLKIFENQNISTQEFFVLFFIGSGENRIKNNTRKLRGFKLLYESSSEYQISKFLNQVKKAYRLVKNKFNQTWITKKNLPFSDKKFLGSMDFNINFTEDFILMDRMEMLDRNFFWNIIRPFIPTFPLESERVEFSFDKINPSVLATVFKQKMPLKNNVSILDSEGFREFFDLVLNEKNFSEDFSNNLIPNYFLQKMGNKSIGSGGKNQTYDNKELTEISLKKKSYSYGLKPKEYDTIFSNFLGNYLRVVEKIKVFSLTNKAVGALVRKYIDLRDMKNEFFEFGVEKIEALIYLSIAHAKCHLRDKILSFDVNKAGGLFFKNQPGGYRNKEIFEGYGRQLIIEGKKKNFSISQKKKTFEKESSIQKTFKRYPKRYAFKLIKKRKNKIYNLKEIFDFNSVIERIISILLVKERALIFQKIVYSF